MRTIFLDEQDSCLTQLIVQAVYESAQNNEHSCIADYFVFFKILPSLLGRSILKVIGFPGKKKRRLMYMVWLFRKIWFHSYTLKMISLHKVYLLEVIWTEFSYLTRFFCFCIPYLEKDKWSNWQKYLQWLTHSQHHNRCFEK